MPVMVQGNSADPRMPLKYTRDRKVLPSGSSPRQNMWRSHFGSRSVFVLSVFVMVCEVAQCRFDDGCWRPPCLAMWATLAAVETERLAPQESTRRQEPEGEAEVPEIIIVSDAVDGTSVDLDDEGVDVPEMPVELVKLISQERVQQRTGVVPVDLVKLVSQERVQQRIAEAHVTGNFPQERISERTQIVDVPVPQILVELVSQERVQQRTAEQIEDAPQFLKETVEMPMCRGRPGLAAYSVAVSRNGA